MSVDVGYLAIMRDIKSNEYYKEPLTMRLYEHLLIDANFKDAFWKGELIKRGQKVTSVSNLSLETGLTIKQVRTALDKLIKGKYLVKKTTNKYTLLTLVEYDIITFNAIDEGKQTANQRRTNGKPTATIEESNNINKEKSKEIERVSNKNALSHFDYLELNFNKELLNLIADYKPKIYDWDFCIEKFNDMNFNRITVTTLKKWLKDEFDWQNKSSNSINQNEKNIKLPQNKRILFRSD
ncbi:hypothetical protein AAGV28_08265 [Flavobacterium sp. FZUC8N2.13]|uniref:Helix-turn-helix domain-containing protein n=1 Tax=Flavobacterium zubiriense TaxID=3138075 RepID=A0ABV4TBN0_9FLAO